MTHPTGKLRGLHEAPRDGMAAFPRLAEPCRIRERRCMRTSTTSTPTVDATPEALTGLEAPVLRFTANGLVLAARAVPIVLGAVSAPLLAFRWGGHLSPRNVPFPTWAGVRGGISVALALSYEIRLIASQCGFRLRSGAARALILDPEVIFRIWYH